SFKSLTYGVQFRTGGGHPRVCWIYDQSANPLSFCHHNFNDLAELPIKKELALHIHYFLAAAAKSYNDTT
ncbi:hypothetical protein, partial [Acinetobacter sp. TG2027]